MIVFEGLLYGRMIAKEVGFAFNYEIDQVIANVTSKGKLLGGVVFNLNTGEGGSIAIHVAGFDPHWMTRDLIWATFDYCFNQLKVKKIIGMVNSSKPKVLKFDLKLGFVEETRIKDYYCDGDLIVLSMVREQCRWLTIKPREIEVDGQASSSQSTAV